MKSMQCYCTGNASDIMCLLYDYPVRTVNFGRKVRDMFCKSCGRMIENENANYCEYCGTLLKEQSFQEFRSAEVYQNEKEEKEEEKPITFGNWAGSMLLPFIPIFGPIVYVVMLIYWSISDKTVKSKKNWARATLVIVVLSLFLLVAYFNWAMQQLVASGFDINTYMQQLNVK